MELSELKRKMDVSFQNLKENIYLEPRVAKIEEALVEIASFSEVKYRLPTIEVYLNSLLKARAGNDIEEREIALIELYIALHRGGAEYSLEEEELLERRRGLKGLPGGILPIILASYLVKEGDVFADLGAGNGIQGLLLSYISPHRLTRQIELSQKHLETGKIYAKSLGAAIGEVDYENSDILESDFENIDVLYMYRPARPMDNGIELYKKLNEKISCIDNDLFVISVADCFGSYLDNRYKKIYENEFLSIFYGE